MLATIQYLNDPPKGAAGSAPRPAMALWTHTMSPPPAPAPLPDADPASAEPRSAGLDKLACGLPPAPASASQPSHAASQLENIFCQHQAHLLQSAYRITGNRDDAEDVLQTVFLRLARDSGELRLRPDAGLGGYLHRMAVHAAIDVLRRRKPQATEGAVDRMTNAAPDPEHAHRGQEFQQLLRQTVASLGGRAPEIFVLRYWEELDNTEIARRLGIPRVTVAVTLHRARRKLQQTLLRHWGVTR